MEISDLKQYLDIVFSNLSKEMSHLSNLVELQGSAIRNIELQTTTRIAELQKDITSAFTEIKELRGEVEKKTFSIEKVEGVAQAGDMSLSNKINELRKEIEVKWVDEAKRWETQIEINTAVRTISKLLYLILGIVLSIFIAFLWELLRNGGIKGLVTP